MHSILPNARKSCRNPRGNDAILAVDARWPHDLGDGSPCLQGRTGSNPTPSRECVCPGFDATPVLLRSPTAFLAQDLAIAPSVAKAAGVRAMETLGIVEAPKDAQGRLRLMGLSIDEKEMPREGDPPNREMDVARVGDKALRKRQASWKQPLAEAVTKCAASPSVGERRECTVAHDERRTGMCLASMRECAWTVIHKGLCQHQRRQKSRETAERRAVAGWSCGKCRSHERLQDGFCEDLGGNAESVTRAHLSASVGRELEERGYKRAAPSATDLAMLLSDTIAGSATEKNSGT